MDGWLDPSGRIDMSSKLSLVCVHIVHITSSGQGVIGSAAEGSEYDMARGVWYLMSARVSTLHKPEQIRPTSPCEACALGLAP